MSTEFNVEQAVITCKRFLTGKLLESGLSGYVIGLSGGIDSAVSCALAAHAVGPDKVLAVVLPYKTSSKESVEHARELIAQLGVTHRTVDISPMIDAYYDRIDESMRVRAGNKMARERMAVLFDIAHETDCLVLGTGNRTEICLGYTTIFGDAACSINPNGELYKTEIRQVARHLNIPDSIIDKHPSADLWAGQTDEGEIGVTYEQIDRILKMLVDNGVDSMAAFEKAGIDAANVSRVVSLMNRNAFKRRMPDIAPLGKPPIPNKIQLQP